MPKATPQYRTDHLYCPLNVGKLAKVRAVVRTMRRVATQEAALQWTQFYKGRWLSFEGMATKGWTRPWINNKTLSTTFSQLVMSQVAGQLLGHFENVKNTYTDLVNHSTLPANIRHQLHSINVLRALTMLMHWHKPTQRVNTQTSVVFGTAGDGETARECCAGGGDDIR